MDASDTFQTLTEPTYYDCCHFRGPGMELFAERIASRLLEEPLAPLRAEPQGLITIEPALLGPSGSVSSTPLASSANASTAQ